MRGVMDERERERKREVRETRRDQKALGCCDFFLKLLQ